MPTEKLIDKILHVTDGNPLSKTEIAEWLGTSPGTVRSAFRRHRDLFRIAGWRREPRQIVSLWVPSDGTPDKPRPRALRNKEKISRYVRRKAMYPELYVKNVIPSAPVSHWHAFL